MAATPNIFVLLCVTSLVVFVRGDDLREKRQIGEPTPEECMRPPTTKYGHECCRLPREKIWGDLRRSFRACVKKVKDERRQVQQETEEFMTPNGSDASAPTEAPSVSTLGGSSPSTFERRDRLGSQRGKKSNHFRRRKNDSCFMECVFEDQGFLMDKLANKEAILKRFGETLAGNQPWHVAATKAVEICFETEMSASSNQTCNSRSEEVFRCIFKQIFFNCPNWSQSANCLTLREFYQKCPNGPPPDLNDNHPTTPIPSPPSPEEEMETDPPTQTERDTQSE